MYRTSTSVPNPDPYVFGPHGDTDPHTDLFRTGTGTKMSGFPNTGSEDAFYSTVC
jgi:hypothetical protein